MFPLELGDSSSIFIPLTIVALGIIVVIVTLALRKRTSAMSDEFSKQSHAKFEAIRPHPNSPNHGEANEHETKSTHTATPEPQEEHNYSALRRELLENKLQINNFIRETSLRVEEEREMKASLERVMEDMSDLRNRIDANAQEFKSQRSEVDKVRERPDVGELWAEIRTLKDRFVSSGEELQKFKALIDEQNLSLKQLRDSETQTKAIEDSTRSSRRTTSTIAESPMPMQTPANLLSTNCSNCGFQLDPTDRFCIRCGQPVASMPQNRSP